MLPVISEPLLNSINTSPSLGKQDQMILTKDANAICHLKVLPFYRSLQKRVTLTCFVEQILFTSEILLNYE